MTPEKRKAYENSIEFSFHALPEDTRPADDLHGTCLAFVLAEIENGNEAAWFIAKVTGHLTIGNVELEAVDFLGACSYASFDEFTGEKGGYYEDMCNSVREELMSKFDTLCEKLGA